MSVELTPEYAEMAGKVSTTLGIEAAPLDELVERASAMIGLEFPLDVPLTERLHAVHEEICCHSKLAIDEHAQLASIPIDELNGDAEALKPFQP